MSPGQSRVELPREETRGRQEDFVGPLELMDLPLQLPQPRRVRGRGPRPAPGIDLRAPAPSAQRVHVDPHPWTDPVHRRRQRQLRLLLTRLTDQANRPLPQLVRVLPRCWHGPVLVGSEPPLNPGRFRPPPAGPSEISSSPPAATAPFRSKPATRPSPPPTP